MAQFSDASDSVQRVRPTFLTVLCILTFLGSGYSLISNIGGYFTAETAAKSMQLVSSQTKISIDSTNKVADSLGAATDSISKAPANKGEAFAQNLLDSMTNIFTVENIKKSSTYSAVAALLCLVGAILMWQLKRPGFFMYVGGTLLGIAGPIAVFGAGNLLAIMSTVLVGFIGLIFVVLYAVNLKHMR